MSIDLIFRTTQGFPLEVDWWGGRFLNNRLLFSLLFSGNFCKGQCFGEGERSRDREIPNSPLPTRENPGTLEIRQKQMKSH